jgi:hypothetical protein
MHHYNGFMVFYNTVGEFLITIELNNGNVVNKEETDKCDSGDGSSSSGGGGSAEGSGPGGTGSGGGFGGGGGTVSIIVEPCYCHDTHASGGCTHPIITIVIHNKSTNNLLKNGCFPLPEECFDDVQDPCECDGNGGCVEENDEVPVNFPINIALVSELNSLLDQNLTPEQIDALAPYGNEFFQSMIDFLNANDTPEAQGFIEEVIDVFAENPSAEVDFEDKIINELKGKEKCLDNLLKESGNDFVKNMIANFVGDDSEFGINIKSKDNVYYTDEDGEISEVSGITKYSSDSNIIKIEISTLKANSRRALQVTRTLLHEYIHADIFRKVYSDSINSEIENFRKTYNDYKNTKFQPTASHQTMAELYLNSMKEALKNFHRQAMVGDYNFLSNNGQNNLDDFYEAIAWQGLRNQNVDAWINLSQDRKEEIDDAYQQYIFAATYNCPN